jgi:hypothetical protein
MSKNEPYDKDASRAFMDALTASDDMHREAMRRAADKADSAGPNADTSVNSSE